jgi:PAS domain-containing protein
VCAWCGKGLRELIPDAPVSHGICDDCAVFFRQNTPTSRIREFLDRFQEPVLLVNSDAVVLTANRPARAMLGKDFPEIENFLCGDVSMKGRPVSSTRLHSPPP